MDNRLRNLFIEWAKENLGQGYSLEFDEDSRYFIDKVTNWCYIGFKAGMKNVNP